MVGGEGRLSYLGASTKMVELRRPRVIWVQHASDISDHRLCAACTGSLWHGAKRRGTGAPWLLEHKYLSVVPLDIRTE